MTRLQRQFDAIAWDAMLNLNRCTVEEYEEIRAIETKYCEASEKCGRFLNNCIDLNTLIQYLVDNDLDVPDIEKYK